MRDYRCMRQQDRCSIASLQKDNPMILASLHPCTLNHTPHGSRSLLVASATDLKVDTSCAQRVASSTSSSVGEGLERHTRSQVA